jgi:tRNA-specific 2-thiouridylase
MGIFMHGKTVVVGMSGGVDSSVTAYLLKEQGFNVIGMFMKNWEEKDPNGVCMASKEYDDVAKVCEQLGIPHYAINFVQEYWDSVFTHFLNELRLGFTPNPDILCNREIKFKLLLDRALLLGADFLATGHYSQIGTNHTLHRGNDVSKDQSYFLYTLKSETLKKVLFPIGHLPKSEVRKIAVEQGLATATKKDSTGICFIGEKNFKHFLNQYIAFQPGDFENSKGEVIGQHEGIAFYTIGQRKGLDIGGPGAAWFVVGKDVKRNVVIVEQGENHPSLFSDTLIATDLSWVAEQPPTALPFQCTAKIRYRQPDQPCIIQKIEEGKALVTFPTAQRAVTPRQSIVFYDGSICLGGGIIQ